MAKDETAAGAVDCSSARVDSIGANSRGALLNPIIFLDHQKSGGIPMLVVARKNTHFDPSVEFPAS